MKSRSLYTTRSTYKIIAFVWIVAILLSSPTLHIMDTTVYVWFNNSSFVTTMSCVDNNVNSNDERIVFAWYQLLVMFLFPVVVILYCYVVVIWVLWRSTKEHARMTSRKTIGMTGRGLTNEQRQSAAVSLHRGHHGLAPASSSSTTTSYNRISVTHTTDVEETRKQLIRMLVLIVTIFFCCWGPKFVLNVMKKHQVASLQTDLAFFASLLLNLLPYVQSCCNPVIYSFMSTRFRRSLSSVCSCCSPNTPHSDPMRRTGEVTDHVGSGNAEHVPWSWASRRTAEHRPLRYAHHDKELLPVWVDNTRDVTQSVR